jgi:tryptophan-rich sensory protein
MIKLGRKFLGHVLPGIVRPMHILWNEVIGFVFICLAILSVPSMWRIYKNFDGQAESLFRMGITLGFALIMLFFGIGSFRRAKKISRS